MQHHFTTGMHQIQISGQICLDLEHKIVNQKISDFTLIYHTAKSVYSLNEIPYSSSTVNLTSLECDALGLAAEFGGHILRSIVEPTMILLTQFYIYAIMHAQ